MKKQDQIDELKKVIVNMHAQYEELNLKLIRERERNDADAKARESVTEREVIAQIRSGSVPIKVLRDALSADYEVTDLGSERVTNLHLHARDRNPLEKALAEALLAPAKPKYATGGYVPTTANNAFLKFVNNFNGGTHS